MTGQHTTGAIRQLQHLLREGTVAGLSDRQLLERFAVRRDEASFAALVGRHGPMVLGVCRRIVRDAHEAEDAFQAAFFLLASKAGSIRVDDSLGRWLYTVTRRIALRAQAGSGRRARLEPADDRLVAPERPGLAERREVRAAFDAEMGRLPSSYRAVVVLCHLEGLTHEEAARRLRWPLGTVKGRLARARGLLRDRLARRGLGLSAGALATLLRPASAPAALIEATVSAAIVFAAGRATVTGAFPAAVALAKEALGTMHMARMKLATTIVLAFGVGLGVAGSGMGHFPGGPARVALADEPAAPARSAPGASGKAAGGVREEAGADPAARAEILREIAKIDELMHPYEKLIGETRREFEKFEAHARGSREALAGIEAKRRILAEKRTEAEAKLGRAGAAPKTGLAATPPLRPPTEGMKRAFPDYVVEPPDLISVNVQEALPGQPIKGERLVRPDGKISLGVYGEVYVAGLTMPQIKEKVVLHLRRHLPDDVLGLVKAEGNKAVAVEPRDSTRVSVDVVAYNSKVYYVQGEVGSPGRMHVTGNETVLDAINYTGGLLPTAAPQNIRLVRPAPPGACCEQVLPVNLDAIVKRGDTSTNYQIVAGDRIVVDRAPPPTASGEDAARHRQIEERLDAMIRELESLRRELREGR